VISGTTTQTGTWELYVSVSDANGKGSLAMMNLVVKPAVSVATTSLPSGVVGTAYSQTLAGADGTLPYAWTSTTLPAGLSLSSGGVISGTPTAIGTTSVTFTIHDANAKTATKVVSMVVNPAVSVTTGSLPSGVVGTAYSQTLAGTNGTSPYTWTSTVLPAGLSLSSDGVISGTPTTIGTTSVTFTIHDANAKTATKVVSMVMNPAVSVSTTSLAGGVVGTSYSQTLSGADGTSPYTWTSTTLPAGLSLSSGGVVSGTPTAIGTTSVTFTIHDANAKTATKVLSMVVNPAVSVSTTSLAAGVVGTSYSQTLAGADGTSPYTWTSTTLPAGLTLSSGGVISGTPTATGTTSVTFTIKDANNKTATAVLSMVVNPAVSVATTTLVGGVVNDAYSATLTASGGTAPYTWAQTGLPTGLTLGTSTGIISGTPTAMGTSSVQVTVTDANSKTATATLSLVINPALSMTTLSLPVIIQDVAYSTTLAAVGGVAPYSWSATGLPTGLTLNSTSGVISGALSTIGSSSVDITVTDSAGHTATRTMSATVGVATAFAGSSGHTCAIVSGAMYCWGANGYGQLGNGTTTASKTPVQVTGLASGVTAIAANTAETCAVVSGAVKCWGFGQDGDLGNGSTSDSAVPVQVTGITSGATAVYVGNYFACALVSGGVQCWGRNGKGQLGNGSTSNSYTPVAVSGMASGVIALASGQTSSCAATNSALKCWGFNNNGQLGNGTTNDSSVPVSVSGITSGVTAISGMTYGACAIVSGAVKCWGAGSSGQLGNGGTTGSSTPVSVTGATTGVTAISGGDDFTCALISGTLKCWGANSSGQVGNGTTTNATTPVAVSGITTGLTAFGLGEMSACATVSNVAKCWGNNGSGQLGDGTTTNSSVPVAVKW
jgi:alpha-tubulin suppressor-like RCC1 family protein